ncbi:MAG: glycosyltransferase [Gaiellales bacterium]|nr:MAG: glycosyltransferase [Gaiellales bacterium]
MGGGPVLGIISHQPATRSMAGPSIRCWEFARALAGDAEVKLIAPEPSDLEPDGFSLVEYGEDGPAAAAAGCDALVCQGYSLSLYPELKRMDCLLVVDLYVPMALEALEQDSWLEPDERSDAYANTLTALMDQAVAGDFFICASERQRDYWLGYLTAAGRVEPEAYAIDASLRSLIDVVPFGVPGEEPLSRGAAVKGVVPGIAADDRLIVWGGGIYNWLDPLTPIHAMALLRERRPEIKLYFMGTRHPDPHVPRMRAYDEAVELSRSLGLLDTTVFFNDRWVPYEERGGYLLEADIGLSANQPHLETRFSFRTRILDYIWARLPIVATDGDVLADLVEANGLGLVAGSGDAASLAAALERLMDDEAMRRRCRDNLAAQAAEMRWEDIVAPVRRQLERLGREELRQPQRSGVAGFQQAELDRRQEEIARLGGKVAANAADIEKLWEMVAEKDLAIEHFRGVIADKDRQLKNPLYRLKVIAANRLRKG